MVEAPGADQTVNRFALCTTVFPSALPFWADFVRSAAQQRLPVDLVVVVDGLDSEHLDTRGFGGKVTKIAGGLTPAENRNILVASGVDLGYEWLVFGDSDDYFDPGRTEAVEALSRASDCIVNDVALVDQTGNLLKEGLWSGRLQEGQTLDSTFLLDRNVAGLSNTAIRTECLREIEIPQSLGVVDWYLFSTAVTRGASMAFTAKTKTYYRQHGDNLVGAQGHLRRDRVLQAIRVKAEHYAHLCGESPALETRRAYFSGLCDAIQRDPTVLDWYVERIPRVKDNNYFWWENAPIIPLNISKE